jgi:hypothetical protein
MKLSFCVRAAATTAVMASTLALFACSSTTQTTSDAGADGSHIPDAHVMDVELDVGPIDEPDAHPVVQVTMNANDPSGTGANTQETFLNISNVNTTHFGKLFTRTVDGDQFAEPLYMGGLKMASGTKNVVFVATQNDSVYAFDADSPTASEPLWKAPLGTAAPIPNPWFSVEWPNGQPICTNYNLRESGITATPAIDPTTNTMYVVALDVDSTHTTPGGTCLDVTPTDANYCMLTTCDVPTITYKLHALDLITGAEKFGGPVVIQGSVSGAGAGSVSGTITFDATASLARPSLLLANGNVYFATASYGDQGVYHGWAFAYDATTLKQVTAYCNTRDGEFGGIWQSGRGALADDSGNVYLVFGNGTFNVNTGGHDYGDSVVRFNSSLEPTDYFSPFLSDYMTHNFLLNWDDDLGSAGATMIPGTTLMVVSGKLGIGYVVDTANLGKWSPSGDNVVQKLRITWRYNKTGCNDGVNEAQVYGTPVAWVGPDGTHVYVWALGDYLRDYLLDTNGKFTSKGLCFCDPWPVDLDGSEFDIDVSDPACGVPASQGAFAGPISSGALAVSAYKSETGTGILWATHSPAGDSVHQVVPGIIEAYDATNVSTPIWSSATNAKRDSLGNWAKYAPVTVANGKVYAPTFSNQLVVYGLLP